MQYMADVVAVCNAVEVEIERVQLGAEAKAAIHVPAEGRRYFARLAVTGRGHGSPRSAGTPSSRPQRYWAGLPIAPAVTEGQFCAGAALPSAGYVSARASVEPCVHFHEQPDRSQPYRHFLEAAGDAVCHYHAGRLDGAGVARREESTASCCCTSAGRLACSVWRSSSSTAPRGCRRSGLVGRAVSHRSGGGDRSVAARRQALGLLVPQRLGRSSVVARHDGR